MREELLSILNYCDENQVDAFKFLYNKNGKYTEIQDIIDNMNENQVKQAIQYGKNAIRKATNRALSGVGIEDLID